MVIASVGGGSNSIGIFHPFINDLDVQLIGVEAGGKGLKVGQHAARMINKDNGVLHGTHSYLLQDSDGQVVETHSISAGLDYPLIGPEHAHLHDIGRASYLAINDAECLEAFHFLCRNDGIIPALESSHAVAQVLKYKGQLAESAIAVVCLSGRGDKDVEIIRSL
jgi:tryptophan synthase beta chain